MEKGRTDNGKWKGCGKDEKKGYGRGERKMRGLKEQIKGIL